MSASPELTPPLESFSGVTAFLKHFIRVCARVTPLLLFASAIIAAALIGGGSLSPVFQQTGLGLRFAIIFFPFMAAWILLITALTSILAAAISVTLGATTVPLGQALAIAARRLPRVIGYSFFAFLTILAGFVCLILPGLYLAVRLFPVAQVALFEPNVNVFKRTWELTQYRTLEVFFAYVGFLVLTFIPSLVLGWVVGFLPSFLGLNFFAVTLQALLGYIAPIVFSLLLYGWLRADIYEPPVTGPEEAYAEV